MTGRRIFWNLLIVCVAGFMPACSTDDGGNQTPASHDPKELALVRVAPLDGASSVPRNSSIRLFFSTTVLPSSVHDQSLKVRTGGTFQTRPEGSFLVSGNIVEFDPTVDRNGARNSLGFDAGQQILIEVPLFDAEVPSPVVNYLQNVEGNPIETASGNNKIAFSTGSTWDDPDPGPPGALQLEFTPGPDPINGLVTAQAAVTVVFDEPVNPETVILSKNIFLTNDTSTAPSFQDDIPSITFFDGSLTRYTFLPVFGFGTGPFQIKVNFIDPDDQESFTPSRLPEDLGGNPIQNFTFASVFGTAFDPSQINTALVREDFTTNAQRDPANTDAIWGDDPDFPFALVSLPITTRNQQVDIQSITTLGGGTTAIDNNPPPPFTNQPFPDEEDYCPTVNPLIGSDFLVANTQPPTSDGRRQLNLFRTAEMQGNGTIIRVAWGPDSDATFAATYPGTILRLGHKRAGTSFATGSFFGQFDVDSYVTVVGATNYNVPQAADINGGARNDDGYLDWPQLVTFFDYDGINELVLDVEAMEGNTWQQFRTFMNVTAIGNCNCVTLFLGACQPNASLGDRQFDSTYGNDAPNPPNSFLLGVTNPSPFVHVHEFELAKLRSDGQSFWYDTGDFANGVFLEPDYLAPILAPPVQPGGASIEMTWAGSMDGILEDVAFNSNINVVDGHQFIRWHAVLRANLFTGARARLELLEVPYTFD
ncbi:MAG: Ig-like domain-containing domain [Planctomycetota bacterium]